MSTSSRSAVLPLLLIGACSNHPAAMPEDLHFPSGFLFGTAIAGFQVDMGCPTLPASQCEDPHSDWYTWITRPELVQNKGLFLSGDPPSAGPGFFELHGADFDRAAQELHNNALRLSLEWSRIFPTATDGIEGYDALHKVASPAGLAFYHTLFAEMKARHLQPFVTLNHYTLPDWIHDAYGCHTDFANCKARGWVDHDRIVREISKYAGFVAREFGGEVDRWATLNEPLTAVVLTAYLFQTEQRTNPPGVFLQYDAAKTALLSMIDAHGKMYDAVKAADTVDADNDGKAALVGVVYNLQAVAPDNPGDPQDVTGAQHLDYLMNQVFLNAVAHGDVDATLSGQTVHRDDLANHLDFLGVNYYVKTIVQGTPTSTFPKVSPLLTFNPIALQLQYPTEGIYEVLISAKRYGVPLFISETGAFNGNDSPAAPAWLVDTLIWVRRAIRDGAPVQGYFYWSLMDNYEWNHGMNIRMGLYAVDAADKTKARRARPAVAAYGRIAAVGQIPSDLAAAFPAP